jgi:NAD(P)-dependent dehydrogenase (short-subunit alcohol dehydrogenase family)
MITIDFTGKTVLITGGTRGIGLACARMFAEAGAQTVLTYKWGTADMDALKAEFKALGAPEPLLVNADVSVDEDTDKVMAAIAAVAKKVDIFISNVGYAATMNTLDDYKKRSLYKTLDYSTWPMIEYTRAIHAKFGAYPEKVVGISSDGPDHYYRGYDFVAASKALLEFFGRYLSIHLFKEGCRVNVMRFGTVKTDSFTAMFGEEFFKYLVESGTATEDMILQPEPCGKAVFALCSGLMDAVNGQVINVDYNLPFMDNSMMRFLQLKAQQAGVPPQSL